MNWSVLVICLCFTSYQASKIETTIESNVVEPEGKQKGFIEWISHLLGGGIATSTSTPLLDDIGTKPKECQVCKCGLARTKRRIVGGQETREREYPWMAMLLYNGRFFCGATLINDLYVLTAAHCTGFRRDRITVRFLAHSTSSPGNDSKIIDRKVSRIIRHLKYNPGTYDNDIALIRLDERIDLSNAIKKRARSDEEGTTTTEQVMTSTLEPATDEDDVNARPACLPPGGLSFTKSCGVVTGWGVTTQGGSTSNTLQEVSVPIVSNKECRDRSYGRRVTENMLCAGEPEGGRDACQGDSGGPLHVFDEKTETYQVVGVVSWGEGCAQPDKYGVYSRVNRFLTWVSSNTKDACYCD